MNEQAPNQNQQTKPLPYDIESTEWLIAKYRGQMSTSSVRNAMKTIKKDMRSGTALKVSAKLIRHCELMEFVMTYGSPKGYHIPDEFITEFEKRNK